MGVGIANKAKCDSKMRSESMLGMGKGRSPVTFMKAGFLERWRQMTDGSVLRREWEVRRGGGKPHHHGKEQERKSSGGKGKWNQEKVVFRMGQRECKILGGGGGEASFEDRREEIL